MIQQQTELERFDVPVWESFDSDNENDNDAFCYDMDQEEKNVYCQLESQEYTFILDSSIWMWNGDYHSFGDRCQFQFAAESLEIVKTWLNGLREIVLKLKNKSKDKNSKNIKYSNKQQLK
jgi:hypothetical protein